MAVRREMPEYDGIYFITITCGDWLHLFEQANAYDAVYKWFDHLKHRGHFILGYVIMPNHLHAMIGFRNTMGGSINRIIGNGKRFIAYEIVKALREKSDLETLARLSSKVNATDGKRGKLHAVFEPSFDWKECRTDRFIDQKLNYIHANPCRGTWSLVDDPCDYIHSSAKYYATGEQGLYGITNFMELRDVDLTKP
ncbi:MAG TPA: hypothetical protein VL728_12780, partial [Cyclobacteriaceae bacterium]|nr:hypothetical protein [Cyclobacteriaceae bacterium]